MSLIDTAYLAFAASISDPPPASVVATAALWWQDLISGPIATAIAGLAVAWVGFLQLSGRLSLKRGATVIVGCFILFAAGSFVSGMQSLTAGEATTSVSVPVATAPVPPAPITKDASTTRDPYGGATLSN